MSVNVTSCSRSVQVTTAVPTADTETPSRWGFPEWFVISQTAVPALLYLPNSQPLRVPVRITAFAISLIALARWYNSSKKQTASHPAHPWLAIALIYLLAMIFHPTTNSLLAGIAQVMLYLAVLAPIFWAPAMIRGPKHLVRLLGILLICNGINAGVGVLQVYDPDRWMPREFSSVVMQMEYGLDIATYTGPDGQKIIRPPGLFDNPGAVAGPGMLATLLGLVFGVILTSGWRRIAALIFSFTGLTAVYLTHVRTSMLILCGMLLVCICILGINKKMKALNLLIMSGLITVAAFSVALLLGGESIRERVETLLEDDPIAVYYNAARGEQLEQAFKELIIEYPLGAGLGRWGMMRNYFGDITNSNSPMIWAELQPNAWILDGGAVLMILYFSALLATTRYELRLAISSHNSDLRSWAPVIVAANAGVLALVFGYTPFTSQVGLQYWFLAGALHGAIKRVPHLSP